MGLIERLLSLVFGGDRNVVRETVEVFRENAETGAQRTAEMQSSALDQHRAEFSIPQKGRFDRFMDAVNRLPRPALALGTLGLFVAAMVDPVWFAARMQGIALVPEPLWWLLGAIVSFYFGARHQMKGQEFRHQISASLSRVNTVVDNIEALQGVRSRQVGADSDVPLDDEQGQGDVNPALDAWRREAAAQIR